MDPHRRLQRGLLRAALVALTGVLLAAATALPALAHAELAETVPAEGEEVADPPNEVVLTFASALAPGSVPEVTVTDPNGDDLVAAPPTVDGLEVVVPMNLAVTPGIHQVDWTVESEDGDPVSGTFAFAFAPPQEVLSPQPATPSETPRPAEPPPTPTSTPSPTPDDPGTERPTPNPSVSEDSGSEDSGSEDSGSEDEALVSDDSGPGFGLVLAALLAVAAAAVVVVVRVRDTDKDR